MNVDLLPKRLLLYGAGGFGSRVHHMLYALGHRVEAVIDRDDTPRSWCHPTTLDEVELSGKTVVLGLFSPQPDVAAITDELLARGCASVISPPSLYKYFASQGITDGVYWLSTNGGLYVEAAGEIDRALGLLHDEESKELFASSLRYRQFGDPASLPVPRSLSEQHTGLDFGFLSGAEGTTLDCGAFTGDTLVNWDGLLPEDSLVLALEPDLENFQILLQTMSRVGLWVVPAPLGVGDRSRRQAILGSGASASLVDDSRGPVMTVTIDELMASMPAGLIKMDIEGSEEGALQGALNILRRDRPRLAISVYHAPQHLWSIQNWLEENVGGYQYRLRSYGHQGYDTVLYAMPH
jgi:FkbM family methyltransferase